MTDRIDNLNQNFENQGSIPSVPAQRCILSLAQQQQLIAILLRPINLNGRTLSGIAGGSIVGDAIADGSIIAAKLTQNSQGWNTNIVFSSPSDNLVSWSSGQIKFADGALYNIGSGNTGGMSAFTYIYFNSSISPTTLQVTTNYSNVIGEQNILLCVAENIADITQTAFFIPSVGTFGINATVVGPNSISTGSIQALAITTGLLAANAVTAAKISVASLIAISISAFLITGQTILGALIETASSGGRITLDSTNGFRAYDGSGTLQTEIPASGSNIGAVFTTLIIGGIQSAFGVLGLTGQFGIHSTLVELGSSYTVQFDNTFFLRFGQTAFNLLGVPYQMNGTTVIDTSGNFIGNGASLTTLNGSNISSGTVADARLSSNIPLKNGSNVFTGVEDLTAAKVLPKVYGSKAAFKAAVVAGESAFFIDSGVINIGYFDSVTYFGVPMSVI